LPVSLPGAHGDGGISELEIVAQSLQTGAAQQLAGEFPTAMPRHLTGRAGRRKGM
jgi:hypothetical protein